MNKMFDFSFNRGNYLIHTKQRKIDPMWKSKEVHQFTQSELQQIQQVLREELETAHNLTDLNQLNSKGFKYFKKRIKKLSALQRKVKHLTNL